MRKFIVDQLRVSVEGKEILSGVNLEVVGGEVHVVMGPNGSGKSTLAYALMGHPKYVVDGGGVWIQDGKKKIDILKLQSNARAKEGLFLGFQNPIAIPGVSVFNLLKTTRREKLVSIVEFYENLKKQAKSLGISEEFLKRSVNDGFSGGERKKMETLQLMALAPKFAILDEPDTGLDVDALKIVAKGVAESAKKGTGILLITHYTRILDYLKPSRVSVLKEGRVVRSGGLAVAKEVESRGYEGIA